MELGALLRFRAPCIAKLGILRGLPFRSDIDHFLVHDGSDFKRFRVDEYVRRIEIAVVENERVLFLFISKNGRQDLEVVMT